MGLENQVSRSSAYLSIIGKERASVYKQVDMLPHYTGSIRDESRLAYAVLANSLKEHLGLPFDATTIRVTKDGKPFQKDNEYYFSLAHSNEYIACAIGLSNLGVDIEQPREISKKLYSKILTEAEIKEDYNPLLTWVIKEAYSKFQGLGLRLAFNKHAEIEMRHKCPHVIQETADYVCALFYTNENTDLNIKVAL